MLLKLWRFITIMLTVVAFATAFSHLLELPPKLDYEPALYLRLHRSLYVNHARIGGTAELLAGISALGLAWRVRRRRRGAFALTLTAGLCLLSGVADDLVLARPAAAMMAGWSLDAIPVDWTVWRDRWEYANAARALLILGALVTLVVSSLRETPDDLVLAQPLPQPPGPGHRQVEVAAPHPTRYSRSASRRAFGARVARRTSPADRLTLRRGAEPRPPRDH
jgi:hypothetical protein